LREDLVSSNVADAIKQLTNHKEDKVKEAAVALVSQLENSPNVER